MFLCHREDRRSLWIIGSLLLSQAWFFWTGSEPGWLNVAILSLQNFCACTICHNAIHVPTFKPSYLDWCNRVWRCCLSFSFGWPVSFLVPGHNLSHHKFTQLPQDVMRTTRLGYRCNLLNLVCFVPTVLRGIGSDDLTYMVRHAPSKLQFNVVLEALCCILLNCMLATQDFAVFFWAVLMPGLAAKWCFISINFLQHDGCEMEDGKTLNFARNFTGDFLNYVTCNNGFHTIHHLHPGLHWSKLPLKHKKIVEGRNHPNLNQSSIFWYIVKTFLVPESCGGGRRKFDGSLYHITQCEPSKRWFDEVS